MSLIAAIPFASDWLEVVSCLGLAGTVAAVYHHVSCNYDGCHRLGRFRRGHLKLCHVHHPLVPNSGRITQQHIPD